MPPGKKTSRANGSKNPSENDELNTSPEIASITRPLSPRDLRDLPTSSLFHRLWTLAVHTPGYDKKEWQELARRLEQDPDLDIV